MGVGASLFMYDVVVKTFTFAISSTDEFVYFMLSIIIRICLPNSQQSASDRGFLFM